MIFATELFRTLTDAGTDGVWDALAPACKGSAYLYGMAVESEWTPGSTIKLGPECGPTLTGVVLAADRPRLLSYTLGDTAEKPLVYVTWELRADPAGTVVRLYVDEVDPVRGSAEELESVWLPVLTSLRLQLDRSAPTDRAATPRD
jgi:hypothetical protein